MIHTAVGTVGASAWASRLMGAGCWAKASSSRGEIFDGSSWGSGAALLRHRRELEQEQQQRADADPVSQALFPIGFPLHVLELPLSIVACMPFPATA